MLTDDEIEKLFQSLELESIQQDFGFWDTEYDAIPPVISCRHEWRKDMFFSAHVYETCTKCGKKKEDL